MIIAADRACYAAKRAGRDRIATAAEGWSRRDFRPTEPTLIEPRAAYSAAWRRSSSLPLTLAGLERRSAICALRPRGARLTVASLRNRQRLSGIALVLGDAQPAVGILVDQVSAHGHLAERRPPTA